MTLYQPQSNPYAGHAKTLDEQLQLYIESGPNFDVSPGAKSKIIVLGNSGVGKTSIIYSHKYGDTGMLAPSATIGASYINCNVVVEQEPIQLQIWDTAGQERFRCMVPMYMRNATAAIIVYDITCRKSFEDVDKWASELHRCAGVKDPLIFLVGNKADLEASRQVTEGEGLTKAAKLGAKFFEISAYDINFIDAVFGSLAESIHDRLTEVKSAPLSPVESDPKSGKSSPIIKLPLLSPKKLDQNGNESKKPKRSCCVIS
ncbi:hypothetical protein FO519_004660 [Halicephalobus sp. NKZ332]|nr:hypothetical protein FO519_004660 [Halicephalobus sp. NKZ332]